MAKTRIERTKEESLLDDTMPEVPPPEAIVPIDTPALSLNNREKLERAKAHIERLFELAQCGMIENVRFHGRTTIEVIWVDSQAQEILPTVSARDRVGK